MQVQVKVDEEGALSNGRFAFSNRYTLITELLQNARRAGATKVDVDYDANAKVLRVIDDGCGIEDFQALLLINKSGWNEQIKAEEQPFGVGFSNCLYSATRVIVTSRGKRIDFRTEAALAKAPIDVTEAEMMLGTTVELHGVDLPGFQEKLMRLVWGFPIPVCLNGEILPRPYALDALSLNFVQGTIGKVHLVGTVDGKNSRRDMVFLQGFCVIDENWCGVPLDVNVVHLDSSQFLARLPDRDQLIDEVEQKQRIHTALKNMWRYVLEEQKRQLDAGEFCSRYFAAASSWRLTDIFDDMPLLPKQACHRIVGYPYQSYRGDADYFSDLKTHLTKDQVESGQVRLCYLENPALDNILQWMFALASGYIYVETYLLNKGHWAHDYVQTFDKAESSADPKNVICESEFNGSWVSGKVVICDAYTISVDGNTVEITDAATFSNDRFLVPKNEHNGRVCLQVTNFVEDGHWVEGIQYLDIDNLTAFIRKLRAVDPEKTFRAMLCEMGLDKYPVLHGKTFRLSVGVDPESLELELVA